ncbi:helix-turn-helix transcriptional regulator [Clostridium sp. UBA1353]|uniref:helix-turn-helix domain-containing protein n=1 Tax=Clostridium sp. UBA1353 TaxID=1946347 RepID=UPI003217CCF1
MNKFGDYLKQLRMQRGLSLKNVEDSLGISASYVHRLESGDRTNPSIQVLKLLGRFYNVKDSELLGLTSINAVTPKIDDTLYIRLMNDKVIKSLTNQLLKRILEVNNKLNSAL